VETIGLPILYATFVWWFSTGLILALNLLPKLSRGAIMFAATVALALSLMVLRLWSAEATVASAYVTFTAALGVWAWIEVAFLTGYVTGPSSDPCPRDARGWDRFSRALATLLWHEVAILAGFALVIFFASGPGGFPAIAAYAILLVMRLSVKINIFLGVPRAPFAFLPDHLRHLGSYFRTRPVTAFFPLSIIVATVLTGYLSYSAYVSPSPAEAISFALLAALAGFALLEHWFLALPIASENLWGCVLPSRKSIPHTLSAPLSRVALSNRPESGPQRSRP
jgi:putative photosynthetic complex assembly protein 2